MIRRSKTSAVWLGFFDSELECDGYLRNGFKEDFGFDADEWCGTSELAVIESEISVVRLLNQFSHKEYFAAAAALKATQLGFDRVSTAYVVFGAEYDESMIENPLAPLTFIGNFGP